MQVEEINLRLPLLCCRKFSFYFVLLTKTEKWLVYFWKFTFDWDRKEETERLFCGNLLVNWLIYLWHNRQAITEIDSINALFLSSNTSLFSIFCHNVSFKNLAANQMRRRHWLHNLLPYCVWRKKITYENTKFVTDFR